MQNNNNNLTRSSNAKKEMIPIDQIEYDSENPRIQNIFDLGREKNEANIKIALGHSTPDEDSRQGTTFRGLRNSIQGTQSMGTVSQDEERPAPTGIQRSRTVNQQETAGRKANRR